MRIGPVVAVRGCLISASVRVNRVRRQAVLGRVRLRKGMTEASPPASQEPGHHQCDTKDF